MNLVSLALRLRAIRNTKKMTLEELAARSGLTGSMLCKIENFRVTPSLPALRSIARGLGVSLATLFDGLEGPPELEIVRAADRKKMKRDNSPWTYYSLLSNRADYLLEPFIVEIPPGKQRTEARAHEGDEFMLMLAGTLDFVHGDKTHRLRQGDSTYSSGSVKHTLVNPTKKPAKILVVYCNAGKASEGRI